MEKSNSDVEELRGILTTISEFLKEIAPQIREILNAIFEQFSGEKVGKDIAAFYKSLVEAGLDKETIKEMTMKYYEERVSIMKMFDRIMENFGIIFKRRKEE